MFIRYISPTAANENKIQRALGKRKSNFTQEEYKTLYPTGSNDGKFYGTAKLHKLPTFGTVDQLPLLVWKGVSAPSFLFHPPFLISPFL